MQRALMHKYSIIIIIIGIKELRVINVGAHSLTCSQLRFMACANKIQQIPLDSRPIFFEPHAIDTTRRGAVRGLLNFFLSFYFIVSIVIISLYVSAQRICAFHGKRYAAAATTHCRTTKI